MSNIEKSMEKEAQLEKLIKDFYFLKNKIIAFKKDTLKDGDIISYNLIKNMMDIIVGSEK